MQVFVVPPWIEQSLADDSTPAVALLPDAGVLQERIVDFFYPTGFRL
jgi:hypothetical protein